MSIYVKRITSSVSRLVRYFFTFLPLSPAWNPLQIPCSLFFRVASPATLLRYHLSTCPLGHLCQFTLTGVGSPRPILWINGLRSSVGFIFCFLIFSASILWCAGIWGAYFVKIFQQFNQLIHYCHSPTDDGIFDFIAKVSWKNFWIIWKGIGSGCSSCT